MEKYYLDTCIWIDYFENRSDRFRPLGDWAIELINKIIKESGIFILSDHLLKELENKYSKKSLSKLFDILPEQLIIKTETNQRQAKEAFKLKTRLSVPFGDALHAILARDNKAILVSRDKHFYELTKEVKVKKPEDLI